MAKIPRRERLRIEEKIESGYVKTERRGYLGVSIIGEQCARKLWYNFHWFKEEKITPQLNRLFQRGHNEEPIIINDLEKVGVRVLSTQKGITTAMGHISGHNDAILANLPDSPKTKHLAEFKTCNQKGFDRLTSCQSIMKWNMTYYIQTQIYMHLFKLKRCLFIVVNKNTDERYYERLKYEKKTAKYYLDRGIDIINSKFPPERFHESIEYYYCKYFCNYKQICHENQPPDKNCRSCEHSEPTEKGKWSCRKKYKNLSFKKQQKGCKSHTVRG